MAKRNRRGRNTTVASDKPERPVSVDSSQEMKSIATTAPKPEGNVHSDDEYGTAFLQRDFDQCFTQMRHYDAAIGELLKFTFTTYTALLGTAVALYQFSHDKKINFIPAAETILGVGFAFGLLMLGVVVRNRVYYVVLARYINQHRRFFLDRKPLGFTDGTGMYCNPTRPRFYSWLSTHSQYICLISFLNSLMLFGLLYGITPLRVAIPLAVVTMFVQIGISVAYLRSREDKSTDHAVFGK